ncbi:cleft lip and palate transmembrane protein 1-domain-containing protein [Myxozyma melibiosi]|uniref:Cleft lip and palate transmembrane protein 1-domain-containing protein n=1 Tax=Myxozyma melibiosi TaxID=54550 RepID=A0ABR1F733_9ASCO
MPPRVNPNAAAMPAQNPLTQMSWWKSIVMMMCIQWFMGQITQKFLKPDEAGSPTDAAAVSATTTDIAAPTETTAPIADAPPPRPVVPINVDPLWQIGTPYEFRLYITDGPFFDKFDEVEPFLEKYDLVYGDMDYKVQKSAIIETTEPMRLNGSIFAHMYVNEPGYAFRPDSPKYDTDKAYSVHFRLTQYLPKKADKKQKHLLGHHEEEENEEETAQLAIIGKEEFEAMGGSLPEKLPPLVAMWHPDVTLGVVQPTPLPFVKQLPSVRQWMMLEATDRRDESEINGFYYPIVFYNQFWQLNSQMWELNSTSSELPINLELVPMKYWKFQLLANMDAGFKQQALTGTGGGDMEELKRILLETNPYLMFITVAVSILHVLFEMLAFKNDISHWKNKKNQVGTSVRTIVANVVMQSIIFLYLMDNNENTSYMVMFTQGSGIMVEAWKITKILDFKLEPQTGLIPYKLVITDKHELNETEKKTQEYDQIAFKYMYIASIPLLGAYAVYSLIYDTHKSWYSFIITTLVGSVYAYGFLMLVPSIYINYRLKSVAHMPRRAMAYKFLNTFIDDLFAFVIKMPILHRLATLRDDVIFLIYLYQTWLYRVDPTRVNEFGQSGENPEGESPETKGGEEKEEVVEATAVASSGAEAVEQPTKATQRK